MTNLFYLTVLIVTASGLCNGNSLNFSKFKIIFLLIFNFITLIKALPLTKKTTFTNNNFGPGNHVNNNDANNGGTTFINNNNGGGTNYHVNSSGELVDNFGNVIFKAGQYFIGKNSGQPLINNNNGNNFRPQSSSFINNNNNNHGTPFQATSITNNNFGRAGETIINNNMAKPGETIVNNNGLKSGVWINGIFYP
jgi:hypothetical protein